MFLEGVDRTAELCDLGRIGNCERAGGEGRDSRGCAAFTHGACALKDARKGVVVRSWDGVKLVIMAAGTAKSHSEEGAPDRVDLLVDKFHFEKFVILQFVVQCAKDEVTRADELGISLDGR